MMPANGRLPGVRSVRATQTVVVDGGQCPARTIRQCGPFAVAATPEPSCLASAVIGYRHLWQ
jgi:hypothetical protein